MYCILSHCILKCYSIEAARGGGPPPAAGPFIRDSLDGSDNNRDFNCDSASSTIPCWSVFVFKAMLYLIFDCTLTKVSNATTFLQFSSNLRCYLCSESCTLILKSVH